MANNSSNNGESMNTENLEATAVQETEAQETQEQNVAKAQQSNSNSASQNKKSKEKKKEGGVINYFRGVKLEMRKVVWPTKKELTSYTIVVLCTCAAFALLFWGLDTGTLAGIKAICF